MLAEELIANWEGTADALRERNVPPVEKTRCEAAADAYQRCAADLSNLLAEAQADVERGDEDDGTELETENAESEVSETDSE